MSKNADLLGYSWTTDRTCFVVMGTPEWGSGQYVSVDAWSADSDGTLIHVQHTVRPAGLVRARKEREARS